ncbi:MAG: hypothetical protein COU69_03115 [Candidatus Pacebacteria bacterium CG10_big_fil_rev_8_21_14_0_10_56_10]|nr:MAG: hypothetical protein COU69_03115 [Candidatus Pacebacteria bacterium CG10_big_fil_rev_8_21_14_0_10_56_10]
MLLGPKKTIISIEPGLMYAEQIKLGKQPDSKAVGSYQWQPETFANVFEQLIMTTGGHQVSVLLSDAFCYVIGCILPSPDALYVLIKSLVAGLVPEDLEQTAWSYRLEPYDQSSKKLNAFVLTYNFHTLFKPMMARFAELIEVVEPISLTLTHELEGAKTSGVILHRDSVRQLAVIIHQGVIVHVQQLAGELTQEVLQPLVSYAQHQLQTAEPYFWLFGFDNNSMLPAGLQAKSTQQHIYPPFSLADRSPQDYAKLLTEEVPAIASHQHQRPTNLPELLASAGRPADGGGDGRGAAGDGDPAGGNSVGGGSAGGVSGIDTAGRAVSAEILANSKQRRTLIVLTGLVIVLILVVALVLVPYFQRG